MHNYQFSDNLEKIIFKLLKKDKTLYYQLKKKIDEVVNSGDVEHYKNLRHDLKNFKRVHIGHFVLVFKFDKENNLVLFEDFDYHDKVYLKKF